MAATVPITLIALYCVQKIYLKTSKQMRILDLEWKSPLYKQFTETLEGLSTIRAFGWQDTFNDAALQKLDTSQRPYYLLFCIQRWLNLVLDLIVAGTAVSVVALALLIPSSSGGGAIGIALTSILSFSSSLQNLVSSWTTAETLLGAVTRTRTFEKETPSELSEVEDDGPAMDWPRGNVDVSDLSVTYG